MKSVVLVFLGGGVGSALRFLISSYTSKIGHIGNFPLGTFIVNLIGCYFIGLFTAYFLKEQSDLKYLFIAGFCGGFTTFSTFALENYSLQESGEWPLMILYILLSVGLGYLAVWLGLESLSWFLGK